MFVPLPSDGAQWCEVRQQYYSITVGVIPWIDLTIYSFLPAVIIIICNSVIIRTIYIAERKRGGMMQVQWKIIPQSR